MARRLVFYVIEALILTIPVGVGLSLVAHAARRFGQPPFSISWRLLGVVFLTLAMVGIVLGERFGPAVIPQYYVAGIIVAGGVLLWMASAGLFCLQRRRRTDSWRANSRHGTRRNHDEG